MVERFLDWLAMLPAVSTYLVLMLLSALENVFPPVPADVAVALGAFIARRGGMSLPLLGVLCWLSNVASAAWMYSWARAHGRAFFSKGWGRKLLPPAVLAALDEAYARYGVLGIFVSRFLPAIRAGVTPFAGVAGLSPARALIPTAAASAIWYVFLVAAGSTLASNWASVRGLLAQADKWLGLAALVFAVFAGSWLWRRSRAIHAQRKTEE